MEIDITQIGLQDLNLSGGPQNPRNLPDDTIFRLRFGNYSLHAMGRAFSWGFFLKGRLSSSVRSNVYLEPFNANANEMETGFMLSYYNNPLYPAESWNAHFNLTYLNHNDSGVQDKLQLFQDVTQEITYALAYRYPTLRWVFQSELYGNIFTNKPPITAFSRANYVYLNGGVIYRLFYGLSIGVTADINLYTSDPGSAPVRPDGYPMYYSPWRLNGVIQYLSSTTFSKINSLSPVKRDSEIEFETRRKTGMSRKEMIDWLGTDEEGAEFIDLELERIRAERKKAELELEKLKERIKEQQK
jgi:hypothetical protein